MSGIRSGCIRLGVLGLAVLGPAVWLECGYIRSGHVSVWWACELAVGKQVMYRCSIQFCGGKYCFSFQKDMAALRFPGNQSYRDEGT